MTGLDEFSARESFNILPNCTERECLRLEGKEYRTGMPAMQELRCRYPSPSPTDSGLEGGRGVVGMTDSTVVLSPACSYNRGRASNVGYDRYIVKDWHRVGVLPKPCLNDPRRKRPRVQVSFSSAITRKCTRGRHKLESKSSRGVRN